ncbi:protein-glutamate O-methyltransferase CheR [Clostridium sp. D2Q-11]|uniref:protein-glutamate O-methyltransferase n=1 Tax=Anaeromonas frigoriresistens TaxID=2683708 RepID=A0A942UWL6_9FIRM|nr:protein-glutamate O-methyltransferase CheR [Anaeromonas frigoriresistens]MBS4539938.1 protein-glutamate O-methyltransferase CheR [Anaeromonas frigoriresistens]
MDKYEKFKNDILGLINIDLSSYKEKQMKRRISSLVSRNGFKDFDDYYLMLKCDKELLNEFMNYLTINVSEFYRNHKQWDVLDNEIIPNLLKTKKKLKVWSSACSTGEEPYSLVMLLSKFTSLSNVSVLATDIDESAIEKAKLGLYSEKSLKELPTEFKDKYFDRIENTYRIKDDVKNRVTFKKMNLLDDKYPTDCDLILCRNVMIYFTEEAKSIMYKKFYSALSNVGVLFVGSTEQIIFPNKYNLQAIETFFYNKKSK